MSGSGNNGRNHLNDFYNGYLDKDRRDQNRNKLQMPVRLDLFLKDEGKEPEEVVGVAQNFTPAGMQICIQHLNHTIYQVILKKKPPCNVQFANPGTRTIIMLSGKVLWGHYHLHSGPRPHCNLGVGLRGVDSTIVDQVKHYFMNRG